MDSGEEIVAEAEVGEVAEPLIGDGVTAGIVRIGDTVRRPVRPFTATVQDYLAHLHEAGASRCRRRPPGTMSWSRWPG